jgi:phosphoserine phosphatase RsbU/P
MAGIIMMMTLYTYETIMKEERITDPRLLLEMLNARIHEIITTSFGLFSYVTFMTFEQTGENEFAYAGYHISPIVYRASERKCFALNVDGFVLGLLPKAEFLGKNATQSLIMEHGDVLILYTDGISETRNNAGKQFGEEGIMKAVCSFVQASNGSGIDIEKLRDSIIMSARSWGAPEDDLTILVMARI